MKVHYSVILSAICLQVFSAQAQTEQWSSVTGAATLEQFMSGLKAERDLPGGKKQTAEYKPDGTGILHAWGDSFARTWKVKGDDQICFTAENEITCVKLEKNNKDAKLYRVQNVSDKKYHEFTVTNQLALAKDKAPDVGNNGGPAAVSAEEMAAKLANPNSPLATLNLKLQYRTFDGDLATASDQSSMTLLFQPSFPFSLDNGDVIFFRPAIPAISGQPVFNAGTSSFESESGLGDISFDLAYGRTTKDGMIYAGGIISSMPTATNDSLSHQRWTMGPEFLLGKITKNYVIGAFPNHQWDVGGPGTAEVNLTSAQLFFTYLPGGGWNVGSAPSLSHDHVTNESTVPLNLSVGKTVMWDGRPWKLGLEINYYVDKPDAFGPDWFIGINIGPVVENMLASWFK